MICHEIKYISVFFVIFLNQENNWKNAELQICKDKLELQRIGPSFVRSIGPVRACT